MKLADISIKRPVFAVMLVAALVVFGMVSYPKIGVDLFPTVEFPIVTVTVVYPGADPGSMESKVAEPLEEQLSTLGGVKVLRSVNLESVTQVIIQFELEVKVDQAMQDVRDKVSAASSKLPKNIDPPLVQKFDIGAAPVLSVALSGKLDVRELTRLGDDVVKDRLQRLDGVGSVDLVGGREREIHVLVRPADLVGRGLTVQDVAQALQAQNLELPAGRIEEGQRELAVKTKGEVRSVAEIEAITIPGSTAHIVDVAEVEDGAEDARSHSSMDGTSAVALVIRKQSDANTVAVAHKVHAELEAMRPELEKAGATLNVPTDNAPYIEHSIADVQFDLWFGALLAVIVILFFLHDGRATIISALAIPTSVVATFAFISVMGFTFNNMTMLALSLSIGILVDDAIVVIENIHRHLEMGKSPMKAAADATREIGLAVLAVTLSIVAVFVPVAVMKGIVGRFFFQFGLTVAFAVLMSMLVSFTLTPMLSSRFLKHADHTKRPGLLTRGIERVLGAVERVYKGILGWALRHRAATLGVAVAALVGSVFMVSKVKAEFIPVEDRAEFMLTVELPVGTDLGTTTTYVDTVADDVRAHMPGVAGTFVQIGAGTQGQVNVGQVQVKMTPPKTRKFHQLDAMAWVRDRYADTKGAMFTVNPINAVGGEGGFKSQPIQFNIRGKDMVELQAAADALKAELAKTPGFVDLDSSFRGGKPELSVDINRDRATELNVPIASIAMTLRALVAGDPVTELKDGLDLWDVTVRMSDAEKSAIRNLDNVVVRATTGNLVPLANLVTVTEDQGPSQIDRQSRQRQITVYAGLEGGLALGDATKIVDAAALKVVPSNLTTDYAGNAEIMKESFGYMGQALFLAVILVYMILAAQFDSFIHPLTIMLSLPLSVVGAFGGLFLSGMTLNIFSMIGFIMLMGLVTKNAILMVDFTIHLRQQGRGVHEALLEAGPIRLRPILMTTLAMIFGMFPVALALGEGGETRAPMAVAVIGGLITSTLLTLVVIPVVYSLVEGMTTSRPVTWLKTKIFGADEVVAPEPSEVGAGQA